MKISVNGQMRDVASRDVARLLAELQFDAGSVATAVNGEFVPVTARPSCQLCEGDRLEVLSPMQGG